MTRDELRQLCLAELPANLKVLAELAENPKASAAIRRKANERLRQELERFPPSGNS